MNATQDIKSNMNNTSYIIETSVNGSKEGKKDKNSIKDDDLYLFLKDTEEINDIIITNGKGEVIYLHSKYDTLDEDFLRIYREDFK
jgi:hypothetical protein